MSLSVKRLLGECHLLLVDAFLYQQISFLGLLCLVNDSYPQDMITDVAKGKVFTSARTAGTQTMGHICPYACASDRLQLNQQGIA